jgi:hypothetical protein
MEKFLLSERTGTKSEMTQRRSQSSLERLRSFGVSKDQSKLNMSRNGCNSSSTLPIFTNKSLVSNINYFLDVNLLKAQMIENQKESLFNQLVKNKKFLQHKRIAQTSKTLEQFPCYDDKALDEIKKILRDTSLDYVDMKTKLSKYEEELIKKAEAQIKIENELKQKQNLLLITKQTSRSK